jgi:N-formylglutamate deformylase
MTPPPRGTTPVSNPNAMLSPTYTLHPGRTPLLLSLPHVGTEIPADQQARYLPGALKVPDTDWHLEALYAFAKDLNRPPENQPMYPGANNTELCPTRAFSGKPIYREGQAPDEAEVQRRITHYWRPYHRALQDELQRLRGEHGHAVLFDGHSIKGELPWLFEGALPDLNLGTASGASCAAPLREALGRVLAGQSRYSQVVDGRFKGGYITRHHGRPSEGVHAVQLEMAWRCYMHEAPPFQIDPQRQAELTPVLQDLLRALLAWRPQ